MNRTLVWIAIAQTLAALAIGTLGVITGFAWQDARRDALALRATLLEPRYEYKTIVLRADGALDRTGAEALKAASISVDDKELTKLGSQGWDIVSSYVELETAFPNFGDDKYVTGLQPNIRPARLVVLLRHRIS